ncbi:hypothetical protein [Serratia marcescens]|uniref:hypothetical protein n=1 Tax=Serratia marcescens TaxID=615 RepID=UPI00074503B0|nr:hypothetical protein [Serratia marcescens]CVB31137.1 Uncharacterised protein [Serratia marcescens]CVB84375.1 Uncharacterised protein [Serratia marcescens]CVF87023.1 Uncharacterised protein [Serratia marcescens]CVG58257.1 Uncharacterised protein [Serratia marcescens]
MIITIIPKIMKVPKKYGTDICCSCLSELAEDECYICQQCNDEIDRQADEVIGNAEDDDG